MKEESTTIKIRNGALDKLRLLSLLSKESQLNILDRLLSEEWEKAQEKYKDRIKEFFNI